MSQWVFVEPKLTSCSRMGVLEWVFAALAFAILDSGLTSNLWQRFLIHAIIDHKGISVHLNCPQATQATYC